MSIAVEQAYLAAVRSDAMVFLKQAFATVYPGKELLGNWHINAILAGLEDSFQGKAPRLIINLPPRYLKSFMVSVAWPAFVLGLDPSAKIICISYSDELAKPLSRDFRRIVESTWYRKIFPNVKLAKVTEGEVVTEMGGSRYATTVNGTLTGRGADFIIIDDPIKPEEAWSDKARESVNEWFRSTLLSRLDDKQRSVLILVMQRLHVNDLTGYVEAGGGFRKLSFAAIATKTESIALRHGEAYLRLEGEPLHRERDGVESFARTRDEIGAHNFASQYQQSPETPDGGMFKRKYFDLVRELPKMDPGGALWVSVDSALATSQTADYSAISVVYEHQRHYWVVHAERGRWDFETLREKVMAYHRRYGHRVNFLIEAAGSGVSLIGSLRRAGIIPLQYRPKLDKIVRAALALPILADKRVRIANVDGRNKWVEPYINEFVTFPHGRFDDQVDSLVQALLVAEQRSSTCGGGFIVY